MNEGTRDVLARNALLEQLQLCAGIASRHAFAEQQQLAGALRLAAILGVGCQLAQRPGIDCLRAHRASRRSGQSARLQHRLALDQQSRIAIGDQRHRIVW